MSETNIPHESAADTLQAQALADEVTRITENVRLFPGLRNSRTHSAPSRVRWHEGILFIQYPEGERRVRDEGSTLYAEVAWDNPNGSRTCFATELANNQLRLTKQTYPPSSNGISSELAYSQMIFENDGYIGLPATLSIERSRITQERYESADDGLERSSIVHFAEAEDLLARLRLVQSAPASEY